MSSNFSGFKEAISSAVEQISDFGSKLINDVIGNVEI